MLTLDSVSFFTSALFGHANLTLTVNNKVPFAFFVVAVMRRLVSASRGLRCLAVAALFSARTVLANKSFN